MLESQFHSIALALTPVSLSRSNAGDLHNRNGMLQFIARATMRKGKPQSRNSLGISLRTKFHFPGSGVGKEIWRGGSSEENNRDRFSW